MLAAEVALKSPFIPLFSKGEFSLYEFNPSLEKGEGEIFGWNEAAIMWRISGTGQ
jgi:hypothetical protein